MNKEIIAAMLSADSPSPINGEGRGGKPYFTKQDAMYCVSGMPVDAWEYMQYVDILVDDKMGSVSNRCSNKIKGKDRTKIQKVCDVALLECRYGGFPKIAIRGIIGISKSSWYSKYAAYYSLAVSHYNNLDSKTTRYINTKLGKSIHS